MSRSTEDLQAEPGAGSASPPSGERRSLRAAPTPRTFYSPDSTPHRSNPPRSASHHSNANGVNGSRQTVHYPEFQYPNNNPPVGIPVATPRNAPLEFTGHKRKREELAAQVAALNGTRIGAGCKPVSTLKRCIMSVRSGIPTEIEWAIPEFVQLTHYHGDALRVVEHCQDLHVNLFRMVAKVEGLVKERPWVQGKDDGVNDAVYVKLMELITDAALALRNLSLTEENTKVFVEMRYPKDLVTTGLNLPDHSSLLELKTYMLDLAEALSQFLTLGEEDQLFTSLISLLTSDDRSRLLGGLRAITRLTMGKDNTNAISRIPLPAIRRVISLLMIEDEELLSASLDFLYQYTATFSNVSKLLAQADGRDLIHHLTRLMLYAGVMGDQVVYLKNAPDPVHKQYPIPRLPQEIITNIVTEPEPERATAWLKCCFEENMKGEITQIDLWQAYQAQFSEYVAQGIPLLPAADFIKNVSVAFTNATAKVNTDEFGRQKFVIQGIKAREAPTNVKGHKFIACQWWLDGNESTMCRAFKATPADLWAHVMDSHLPRPGENAAPTANGTPAPVEPVKLTCHYAGCTRFPQGSTERRAVVAHVRTHMPAIPKPPRHVHGDAFEDPQYASDPDSQVLIRRCQTNYDESGNAIGIPLSAVLVLRNIARKREVGVDAKGVLEVLGGVREELFEVMTVNRVLASYISDLVVNPDYGVAV